VLSAAAPLEGERALDLYSGCGNFALPLAAAGAGEVLGVESDAESVEAARRNARANGCENASFERRLAHDALRRLVQKGEKFGLAVLDPPRAGAGDCLRQLPRLGVRRVVYVSCSLESLARDLEILQRSGYALRSVKPYDLFPQTSHLECVALLERTLSLEGP
jgi:23S rRNA (uracil1939-C5)-methyltransferase